MSVARRVLDLIDCSTMDERAPVALPAPRAEPTMTTIVPVRQRCSSCRVRDSKGMEAEDAFYDTCGAKECIEKARLRRQAEHPKFTVAPKRKSRAVRVRLDDLIPPDDGKRVTVFAAADHPEKPDSSWMPAWWPCRHCLVRPAQAGGLCTRRFCREGSDE